jgi:ribose 5-phosphate isomerase B
MKVAIGSDHRGYLLKEQIKSTFSPDNIEFSDLGTKSAESCDFPDNAFPVAQALASGQGDNGILICSTGNGMAMAANKVKGIRAALALTPDMARLSRQHNNANILVLPADFVDLQMVPKMVKVWLETEYEGGRLQRRLDKITKYEEDHSK